jgi:hypothetical protein
MSTFDEALLHLISKVSKKTQQTAIVDGEVIAVNKDAKTCTVKVDEREIPKVRINSILEAGTNVIDVFPSVGSKVVCGVVEGNPMDMYVIDTNDIDEIIINGGENGGLVITPTLVQELEKNNAIVEALLNVINGVSITETGNGAVSALQAALSTAVSGLVIGDFSEIENEKIKH